MNATGQCAGQVHCRSINAQHACGGRAPQWQGSVLPEPRQSDRDVQHRWPLPAEPEEDFQRPHDFRPRLPGTPPLPTLLLHMRVCWFCSLSMRHPCWNTITGDLRYMILCFSDGTRCVWLCWGVSCEFPLTLYSCFEPGGRYAGCRQVHYLPVFLLTIVRISEQLCGPETPAPCMQVGFSPDGHFLMSGDGGGKLFFWNWTQPTHIVKTIPAHDKTVCIGCEWHPFETSKVATCGWDGLIKYWD